MLPACLLLTFGYTVYVLNFLIFNCKLKGHSLRMNIPDNNVPPITVMLGVQMQSML